MASSWTCGRCAAQNEEAAVSCRTCGLIRGGVVTAPNPVSPPVAPGPMAPAPGGYPGAPVPPPLAASPRRQAATGLLANVGVRLLVLGVILAIGAVVAFVSNAGRDSSGNINKAGDVPVSELRLGDCYDLQGDMTSVEKTTGIPCGQPHHYEVFYTGTMTGLTSEPTSSDVDAWGSSNCLAAFEAYVGLSFDQSSLEVAIFYPDSAGWAQGDRGAQCSLHAADTQAVTGSMKGAKR